MPEITCPTCGERLDVPVELLGQTIRCGACQSVIEAGMVVPPPQARMAPQRPREVYRDDPRFNDEPPPQKKRSFMWLWLLLGFGALSCAGCCGLLGYLGFKIENPTWTKYTPPDGRFTVEFPGDAPQIQTRSIAVADGKPLTMSLYVSERKIAQERYAVGVCDLPKIDGGLAKIANEVYLEAAMIAFKNQQGVRVTEISRSNMTLFGQPGKEFVGTFSDSTIRNGRVTRRLFILNDKLYMLSVLGKDDGPSAAKTEHFFSSFNPADAAKK